LSLVGHRKYDTRFISNTIFGAAGDQDVRVGDVFREKSDEHSQRRTGVYASDCAAQRHGEQRLPADPVPRECAFISRPTCTVLSLTLCPEYSNGQRLLEKLKKHGMHMVTVT